MTSEDELIVDSEPEREMSVGRSHSIQNENISRQNRSKSPNFRLRDSTSPNPAPIASTSTSRYFSQPAPPTLLAPAHARTCTTMRSVSPFFQTSRSQSNATKMKTDLVIEAGTSTKPFRHSHTISLDSNSSSNSSKRRLEKSPAVYSDSNEMRPKKKLSKSEFVSAADLLASSPILQAKEGEQEVYVIEQIEPKPKVKRKKRRKPWETETNSEAESEEIAVNDQIEQTLSNPSVKRISGTPKTAPGDIPIRSTELTASLLPPPINLDEFTRELYKLPKLEPNPKKASPTKSIKYENSSLNADLSVEILSSGDEHEPITAASKLRTGLAKFSYDNGKPKLERTQSNSATPIEPSRTGPKLTKSEPKDNKPHLPITLPPLERVRALTTCPVCATKWNAKKTVKEKSIHLENCSQDREYNSDTLKHLVDQQILELAKSVEHEKRREEASRTIFDRAIGKGEGADSRVGAVKVVGVELQGLPHWNVAAEQAELDNFQRQVDSAKRKSTNSSKLLKEAKQIKLERKLKAELQIAASGTAAALHLPPSSAAVQPASTLVHKAAADRAQDLLQQLGGTGLTQTKQTQNSLEAEETAIESELDSNAPTACFLPVNVDDSDDLIVLQDFGPPSTQPFEPSNLAEKFQQTGEIVAISLPSKSSARKRGKRAQDKVQNSLWTAANGTDDETIRRVVLASSPLSDSFSPDSSIDPSATMRLSPCSPTLTQERVHPTANTRPAPLPKSSETQNEPESKTVEILSAAVSEIDLRQTPPAVLDPSVARGVEIAVDDEIEWRDDLGEEGILVWEGERNENEIWLGADEDSSELSSAEETLISFSRRHRKLREPQQISRTLELLSNYEQAQEIPATKSPRKKKTSSPESVSSPNESEDDALPAPPGLPDYENRTLAELQKEVARFGLRVSKEKSVLVQQLTQIWIQTHPNGVTKSGRKRVVRNKKAAAVPEEASGEPAVPDVPIGERLRALLVGNEEIYKKILRYEPIFFDELVSLVANNGIKLAKPVLMRYLDEQSITFYTQNPTNGNRARYK